MHKCIIAITTGVSVMTQQSWFKKIIAL